MAERISLEKLDTVFYYAVGTLKFHTDVRCSTLRCYYLAALVTSFMDYGNSFPGHHANISPWSNSPACYCERSFQQALWKCHLPVQEAMDPPSSAWQSCLSHQNHQPPNTALLTASLQLQSLLLSRGPALPPSAHAWPPHSAAFSEDATLPCGPGPPSLLWSLLSRCPSLPPGLAFTQQLRTCYWV